MNPIVELKPIDGRKSFYNKANVELLPDGTKVLISYTTRVGKITPDGKYVQLWDGKSATTSRHIRAFKETFGAK